MIDDIRSVRVWRALFLALSLILSGGFSATAQDLFEVTGLSVDESDVDEVRAKFNAIADAQRRALEVVFRRLVQPEDYGRLPQPGDEAVALMVRDFDISEERFGGGRYLATVSVRFLPQEVASALKAAQIPFAMTRSRPLVVLPVIDTGSARRLWDDPNPWRGAWAGRLPSPGLFSMVMPNGDLSDVATVNVNQAIGTDPQAMAAIARKYEAGGAMVATASVGRGGSGSRSVRVVLSFVGGNYDGDVVERRYTGSGDLPSFLGQVVDQLITELERDWKNANMLDFSREERISVLVPISGLDTWLQVRERLGQMARVQSATLARMSREEAEVDLVFVGSTDQLRSALAQQGLELVYSPDHPLWLLRPVARR